MLGADPGFLKGGVKIIKVRFTSREYSQKLYNVSFQTPTMHNARFSTYSYLRDFLVHIWTRGCSGCNSFKGISYKLLK